MPIYSSMFDGPARNYRRVDGRPVTSGKKYQTVHATANDATAQEEASYAKIRTDGTSSHYYADNQWVIQSLNTDWCAGHVGSYEGNTFGISWEFVGVNAWSRQQWLNNIAWELAAAQMAEDCRNFAIPARLLTIAEMRAGNVKGFITHDMARIAWGKTDHTDPGPNFPMDHLLNLVAEQLDGDDMAFAENANSDPHGMTTLYRVYDGILNLKEEFDNHVNNKAEPSPFAKAINGLVRDVAELKTREPVIVTDEQLERVLRKVIGSVDEAQVRADAG